MLYMYTVVWVFRITSFFVFSEVLGIAWQYTRHQQIKPLNSHQQHHISHLYTKHEEEILCIHNNNIRINSFMEVRCMANRLFYMFHLYCNLNYQRQLTNCKWIEWQFLNLSRIVKYFFLTKPFKCRLNCCIFSSFILVDLKSRRQKPIKLLSAYPTLGIGKKYWVFFVKWFFF